VKHGEALLRTTNDVNLIEAILLAAERVGKDKGTGGLVGYLSVIAREHPALFVRLLEKVLACEAAQNEERYGECTPEEAKIPRSSKSGWN
jgi:hypothetical protein